MPQLNTLLKASRTPVLLASLASLLALSPRAHAEGLFFINSNFTGHSGSATSFLTPPDTDGCIGPNHYVAFLNGSFTAYDRFGTPLLDISDNSFWTTKASVTPTTGISDPRIVYDPASQRWFASQIDFGTPSGSNFVNNNLLLAVSASSDPTGAWTGFKFPVFTSRGTSNFGDYPTLAVDGRSVILSTIDFNSAGTSTTGTNLVTIPKADLLSATPTVANRKQLLNRGSITTYGFCLQGINNFDGASTITRTLATNGNGFNALYITPINNAGSSTATLGTPVVKTVTSSPSPGPVPAPQPGTTVTLDTSDDRFSAAPLQVGNYIWAVQSCSLNSLTGIAWYKLDATTLAVLQQGQLGKPGFSYSYPSIAANANGDVVIGFTRTGTADDSFGPAFASAFCLIGNSNGNPANPTTFGTPKLLKAGNATYLGESSTTTPPVRWGDYSMTFPDPTLSNAFWTIQEYAVDSTTWGTNITQILLPATVPDPAALSLLTLPALALPRPAHRRHRSTHSCPLS
jgi:hypothetical protein